MIRSDFVTARSAAVAALNRRDMLQLGRAAQEMIRARPGEADGHFFFGLAAEAIGRASLAVEAIEEAARLAPKPEYFAQRARLLLLLRQDAAARRCAAAAVALAPRDAATLDTLGCVFARLGDHAAALPLFERAAALQPRNVQLRFNLAATLGFLGRTAEAEEQHEAILKLDPDCGKAHLALATGRRATAQSNPLARLTAALGRARDPEDVLEIRYALAQVCEDLGEHHAAFAHLQAANSRRRAELAYEPAFDRSIFQRLARRFAEPDYFRGGAAASADPIFVVGLPRTGTTLVDRILSSHPDVRTAGELQAMPLAVKLGGGSATPLVIDPETIDAAARLDPAQIGEGYLQRAATHHGAGGRFVDKLPLNFLYVGYIARALPNARIVCLRRHPMDSVWSNYKHLFSTEFSYYNYAYDLLDTAAYYVQFDRLMAFWERLFPGRVLQVSYEGLVADQEGWTRRILDHCGLSWSDACLRFHENAAAVATPSAAQVRRPLYGDAVGRWRAYAQELEPVRQVFEAAGIVFD